MSHSRQKNCSRFKINNDPESSETIGDLREVHYKHITTRVHE